jgi:hypothetical protein
VFSNEDYKIQIANPHSPRPAYPVLLKPRNIDPIIQWAGWDKEKDATIYEAFLIARR